MQTKKRPKSLTVIAVILIVSGVICSLITIAMVLLNIADSAFDHHFNSEGYLKGWRYYYFVYELSHGSNTRMIELSTFALLGAMNLVSGITVLKGRGWGRWFYICVYPFCIIAYAILIIEQLPVVNITIYIISLTILARPAASEFFRKETVDE